MCKLKVDLNNQLSWDLNDRDSNEKYGGNFVIFANLKNISIE